MTVSEQDLNRLQQLLASDDDLRARLRACATAPQAAALLAGAAARQGVVVQPAALLKEDGLAACLPDDGRLDDAALEVVAGGRSVKPPSILS